TTRPGGHLVQPRAAPNVTIGRPDRFAHHARAEADRVQQFLLLRAEGGITVRPLLHQPAALMHAGDDAAGMIRVTSHHDAHALFGQAQGNAKRRDAAAGDEDVMAVCGMSWTLRHLSLRRRALTESGPGRDHSSIA